MDTATLLPALSMSTLGLTLLVIVVGFAIYWRKRSNRAPPVDNPAVRTASARTQSPAWRRQIAPR